MKNLSFDLWKTLNLPMNLYYILQEKVNLIENPMNQQYINPFNFTFGDNNSSNIQTQTTQVDNSQFTLKSNNISQSQFIFPTTQSQGDKLIANLSQKSDLSRLSNNSPTHYSHQNSSLLFESNDP